MRRFPVKTTKEGKAYLNIGCGAVFFSDWNNIDFFKHKDVYCYDVRRGLPYPDAVFDVVYSSHTLEHFSHSEGRKLLAEMFRVLKSDGIIRIAVPDLEQICREYLARLDDCRNENNTNNRRRYQWAVLELYDQMVREKSGGRMLEVLGSGDVDIEYIKKRNGDQFQYFYTPQKEAGGGFWVTKWLKDKLRSLKQNLFRENDPRKHGELHRWMYDSYSLGELLRQIGFKDVIEQKFNISKIHTWDRHNLDKSEHWDGPRKPDSLFMEGVK